MLAQDSGINAPSLAQDNGSRLFRLHTLAQLLGTWQ
jgi:hypothetical protein